MRMICKYPLKDENIQMVEMPEGAIVLTVQVQRGIPCIWAEADADPNAPTIKRRFVTYGIGHWVGDDVRDHYVGTYQLDDGDRVFHVFTDRVEYPKNT